MRRNRLWPPLRRGSQEHQVVHRGGDAALNPHDELDVHRAGEDALVAEIGDVVDHARVIDLKLRDCAVFLHGPDIGLNAVVGVGKHVVVGAA